MYNVYDIWCGIDGAAAVCGTESDIWIFVAAGQDGSYAGVLILAVLLIAYIFAVFVRNNLCTGSESEIKESKIVFLLAYKVEETIS